jgi:hypothetical protein
VKIALGVEYDGSGFVGWQRQRSGRTVQSCVERALSTVAAETIRVHCAGRTDTGVHASGQVIHFETDVSRPPRSWVLGGNLPGVALGSRVFARIFYFTLDEGKKEKNSDYIFFLQTRGFGQNRIVFYYIFRKIFPLILIFILIDFSSLLSGSIIVEEIFFFPGIGKSIFYAVKSLDENLLRALLFYSGIIFYILTRSAKKIQFKLSME